MDAQITRVVVVGAGGIGGSIAAQLALRVPTIDVTVVIRGAHGRAIAAHGLRYSTPQGNYEVPLTCVESLAGVSLTDVDLVVVATKIDGVSEVARELSRLDTTVPTLCVQNGVAGERLASAHLPEVYGAMVYLAAAYLTPGLVENYCANTAGVFRIGSFRGGSFEGAEAIAALLSAAGFDALAVESIAPWKYGKLLTNLANAIGVSCTDPRSPEGVALYKESIAEGKAVFRAAKIEFLDDKDLVRGVNLRIAPIDGKRRPGSSMEQSVLRQRPTEVAYLNGEVVRLGALHCIPTPVNSLLVDAVSETVQTKTQWTAADLRARIDGA